MLWNLFGNLMVWGNWGHVIQCPQEARSSSSLEGTVHLLSLLCHLRMFSPMFSSCLFALSLEFCFSQQLFKNCFSFLHKLLGEKMYPNKEDWAITAIQNGRQRPSLSETLFLKMSCYSSREKIFNVYGPRCRGFSGSDQIRKSWTAHQFPVAVVKNYYRGGGSEYQEFLLSQVCKTEVKISTTGLKVLGRSHSLWWL